MSSWEGGRRLLLLISKIFSSDSHFSTQLTRRIHLKEARAFSRMVDISQRKSNSRKKREKAETSLLFPFVTQLGNHRRNIYLSKRPFGKKEVAWAERGGRMLLTSPSLLSVLTKLTSSHSRVSIGSGLTASAAPPRFVVRSSSSNIRRIPLSMAITR